MEELGKMVLANKNWYILGFIDGRTSADSGWTEIVDTLIELKKKYRRKWNSVIDTKAKAESIMMTPSCPKCGKRIKFNGQNPYCQLCGVINIKEGFE